MTLSYFPPDTQDGTIDPFPPTIVNLNGVNYEYARRYGTLEDPPDLTNIMGERIALVGIITSGTYIGVDIIPTLENVNDYYGVISEATQGIGNTLTLATHFDARSFSRVTKEYGFSITGPVENTTSEFYGFYQSGEPAGISTTRWGVHIDSDLRNYFKGIVIVGGRKDPIGINCGTYTYRPIVQIFNNPENLPQAEDRRGLYVEGPTSIGGYDSGCNYMLHVQGSTQTTGNLKVGGNGDIDGTLNVGKKLTIESEGFDVTGNSKVIGTFDVTGNTKVTGTLDVTSTTTAPTFIGNLTGNVTGTASGNKLLSAFDIPHVKEKGKRIRHIVAEGPEPGIYIRGKLTDSNIIELPEYWDGLIDPETITVTLTQIGYSQDLIVEKIEWGKRIKIKSGTGANINCFYEVWAARWLNPMNHEEKLHVVYEGESPKDYPGNNESFLVGGWDYDRRRTEWT